MVGLVAFKAGLLLGWFGRQEYVIRRAQRSLRGMTPEERARSVQHAVMASMKRHHGGRASDGLR
ncbi:MAG: hypothetical protein HYZ75_00845 [Elusimicrobia bacterium]|nr:hypothetical protein [Elusimicrobiota bacterium]